MYSQTKIAIPIFQKKCSDVIEVAKAPLETTLNQIIRGEATIDAYDEAIQKLIADGTVSRLAIEYFGEDVSALLK